MKILTSPQTTLNICIWLPRSMRWRFLHPPPNHTQHMYMTSRWLKLSVGWNNVATSHPRSTKWRFLHPPRPHSTHVYDFQVIKIFVGWNNVATHWWFLYTFIVQMQLHTHPLCLQLIFLWHQLIHFPDCDHQTHCDKQRHICFTPHPQIHKVPSLHPTHGIDVAGYSCYRDNKCQLIFVWHQLIHFAGWV